MLVAHDPEAYDALLQRRREPDALVRPALALGPRGSAPELDAAFHDAWRDGYETRQPRVRRRGCRRAGQQTGRDGVLPRLPPLSRAALRARRAARREARALRAHPVAGRLVGAARRLRRAVHDGLLANDVVGVSHRALGAQLPAQLRRRPRAGPAGTRVTHHADLDRRRGVRRAGRRATEVLARGGGDRRGATREADRPRRPHRPVEEHRARLPRVRRCCSSGIPSGAGACSMLALLDPSRETIPEYVAYREAIERRGGAVNERREPGGCPSTCRSRTTSRGRSPRTSSTTCCS